MSERRKGQCDEYRKIFISHAILRRLEERAIIRTRVNLLPKRYYGFGAGEFRINSSEAILALKPATFRYKQELDPAGIPQFGLVAEEVAK